MSEKRDSTKGSEKKKLAKNSERREKEKLDQRNGKKKRVVKGETRERGYLKRKDMRVLREK